MLIIGDDSDLNSSSSSFYDTTPDFFDDIVGNSSSNSSHGEENLLDKLNVPYTIMESLVAITAVIGNALVIIVFYRERRLRRRTNYYIISLAFADFLVGLLGIPFAILTSVGLPKNLYACLLMTSSLVALCIISIFCLLAVSIDRYWAILHPLAYSRNVGVKTVKVVISVCWFLGSFVGFLPLLGWYNPTHWAIKERCFFTKIMEYNYLVFFFFAIVITPSIILIVFYGLIYRVILDRKLLATNQRMLKCQKREMKAAKNFSIIVAFFMICWVPLFTINCVNAFCNECFIKKGLINFTIILSHLNSAINPLLYAYHLKDFRGAFARLLTCTNDQSASTVTSLASQNQNKNNNSSKNQAEHKNLMNIDSPVQNKKHEYGNGETENVEGDTIDLEKLS